MDVDVVPKINTVYCVPKMFCTVQNVNQLITAQISNDMNNNLNIVSFFFILLHFLYFNS